MLFDNPIFFNWYTDIADVYRVVSVKTGNVTRQERKKVNKAPIPCRIYAPKKDGPVMTDHASRDRSSEKMACDLTADIRAGDELHIIRGGNLGHANQQERYFAGDPVLYHDPVGGALTGLEHMEVGLLKDNIIGGG